MLQFFCILGVLIEWFIPNRACFVYDLVFQQWKSRQGKEVVSQTSKLWYFLQCFSQCCTRLPPLLSLSLSHLLCLSCNDHPEKISGLINEYYQLWHTTFVFFRSCFLIPLIKSLIGHKCLRLLFCSNFSTYCVFVLEDDFSKNIVSLSFENIQPLQPW